MDFNKVIAFIREHHLSSGFIPLHAPVFNGREKEYLLETIDSTFVSSVGAFVDRFEEQMAAITATKRAVATVNGTAALQVALQLAGVQRSDEVITQALTFVATANAIAYNGAEPIFLDVDFDTMGLSPQAVAAFLEEYGDLREGGCYNKRSGRRLAACMPMHTFGFPVHIEELIRICRQWRIPVVEDAAEALGSLYKGKPCGSFGQMGTFSFNGNKIVTCGGGGAIVTQEDELGNQAKHLTTTAKAPHQWEYAHDALGYNFRMTDLQAAIGIVQLTRVDAWNRQRRQNADYLSAHLAEVPGVETPAVRPGATHVFHQYTVGLSDRAHTIDALTAAGIGYGIYYPIPIHKQEIYLARGYDVTLPVAEAASERVLSLPVHPALSEADLAQVVGVLRATSVAPVSV